MFYIVSIILLIFIKSLEITTSHQIPNTKYQIQSNIFFSYYSI